MTALTVHHPDPDDPLALYHNPHDNDQPSTVTVELRLRTGDLSMHPLANQKEDDGFLAGISEVRWNLTLGWVPTPVAASMILDRIAPRARTILFDTAITIRQDGRCLELSDIAEEARFDVAFDLSDSALRDAANYRIGTMTAEDWFDGNDEAVRDGLNVTADTSDDMLRRIARQTQQTAVTMHEPAYVTGVPAYLRRLRDEATT